MVKNVHQFEKGIVLFDGECNFCNATVQFIIKFDKNDKIRFASQQSKIGIKLLNENGSYENLLSTIVFIKNKEVFIETNALLEICKLLVGFPQLFIVLKIIPSKIRDFFYKIFSKNRYSLFGKRTECLIPTEKNRSKFLK